MADISPSAVPGDEHFYRFLMAEKRTLAAAAQTLTGKASATQTDTLSVYVVNATNGDMKFLRPFPHGATVTELRTQTVSGSCTVTAKVNTTAMSPDVSASSSETAQAYSSGNVFLATDNLTITIASNSSAVGLTITLTYSASLSSA